MHSSIFFASTLLAALTAAVPTPMGQVVLQLGISVTGDDSSDREVPFGKLATVASASLPPAATIVVSGGDGAPISDELIVCQAFSDASGKTKLGSTLSNVLPGIRLSSTQLVTIGSVFCSDAVGVAAFSSSSGSTTTPEATIQVEFDNDEGAAQGKIPVDNVLTAAKGSFASAVANSASIISIKDGSASNVKREAFGDTQGRKLLGTLNGNGDSASFAGNGQDVPLGAFKCSTV